ncbi:MAG: hypothetical protein MJ213_01940 [Bacilli bacterium]|nr:hypothetical protein [Bacilli bacterium]
MQINKIKQELKKQRFGIIGKPSDWLISSIPDLKKAHSLFGITFINIKMDEVASLAKKAKLPYQLKIKDKFNQKELKKADYIYQALNVLVKKHKLTGLTTRCFDLLTSLKSTACLALAEFNNQKIIATCEGDVTAMISMKIASLIGDGYTFQANPSYIDVKNKKIILAHCTIPTKMTISYKLDTHFESGIGVAIKGKLKTTDITMFRLSSNLKDYFVAEGKIIKNGDNPQRCRTQIEVKFKDDISSLLTNPCGNHHIIFYGKHKKEIQQLLAKILV